MYAFILLLCLISIEFLGLPQNLWGWKEIVSPLQNQSLVLEPDGEKGEVVALQYIAIENLPEWMTAGIFHSWDELLPLLGNDAMKLSTPSLTGNGLPQSTEQSHFGSRH